jgi:hypothetical protein
VIARFGGLAPLSCGRRETIGSPAINLRDVGVAGSNPVTPTIEYSALLRSELGAQPPYITIVTRVDEGSWPPTLMRIYSASRLEFG